MLIGISGKIGAGKTTAAHLLQEEDSRYTIHSFANLMKVWVTIATGIGNLNDQQQKKRQIEWLGGMTVRELLQKLGNSVRNNIDPNFWVNALLKNYTPNQLWIIDDVRYLNEAQAIKLLGGHLIRLNIPTIREDEHISETQLDDYPGFDFVYKNTGTIGDLKTAIINGIKDW